MNPLQKQLDFYMTKHDLSMGEISEITNVNYGSFRIYLTEGRVPGDDKIKAFSEKLGWSKNEYNLIQEWATAERIRRRRWKKAFTPEQELLIDELINYIETNKIEQKVAAKDMGVYQGAITRWKHRAVIPNPEYMKKIKVYLKDAEDNLVQPFKSILDMNLVRAIEKKYGSLGSCPDEEPMLAELREKLGVKASVSPYDKEKVEKIRRKQGWLHKEIGSSLGMSDSWYQQFRSDKIFSEKDAKRLAELFGVEHTYFLKETMT